MQVKVNSLGKQRPRIGIDLMGGDTAPEELFQGVLALTRELKESVHCTLFATPAIFEKCPPSSSFTCVPVQQVISMEDDPLATLRQKKESSLDIGMSLLKKGELDAFVSAGNTGALLACARMSLPMLPGIARPALLALLPTKDKEVAVLDIGANIVVKAEHMVQFALMGMAYQKCRGIEHPTVGLLNIGTEARKGTPEHREAYQQLQKLNIPGSEAAPIFIGNVEGRDVFQGHLDVLVTDGFTGNVFLKTAEGIAAVILEQLETNALEQCSPLLKEVLDTIRHRLHYAEYPGAILCGVDGIVVKCHGDSGSTALTNAVRGAIRLVNNGFLEKIKSQLESDKKVFSTR